MSSRGAQVLAEKETIYLDHAASSFPKAPGVAQAVAAYLTDIGANPGRSAHKLSMAAARIIYRCREAINKLFSGASSERIVFTANVTQSINTVLWSHLPPGAHVVTTTAEHNALMRPLHNLSMTRGIQVTRVQTSPDGNVEPQKIAEAITDETRLVALMHGSNVTGVLRPLRAICSACQGVPLLVDAAQTAGAVPISLQDTPVDFFCFTGHKGLLGPTGTGGIILGENVDLAPFICGGTGSRSEEEEQPDFLPDSLESGTPNTAGIAGLLASVNWLLAEGVGKIEEREKELTRKMISLFSQLPAVELLHVEDGAQRLPTISLRVKEKTPSTVGLRLDREANVCVRVGLHCSPSSHRSMGTWPYGTVRISAGPFTKDEELEVAATALERIATS